MRIQHNIMAMSAYRNYNTNTSAVAKNLEKLSSGYKINRAGDDAAGLAISEKMRAQITGLNAAQKNVKDGISLVKTAEGAMQEIQDMLNRMDYLATQSANGTYQDEVDREALQKEVNQLLNEIDRIAESANFNGIQLLDGSKNAGGSTIKGMDRILEGSTGKATGKTLADVGKKTFLDGGAAQTTEKTKFAIDFSGLTTGAAGGAGGGGTPAKVEGTAGNAIEVKAGTGGTTGTKASATFKVAMTGTATDGESFTVTSTGGTAGKNIDLNLTVTYLDDADGAGNAGWKVTGAPTGYSAAFNGTDTITLTADDNGVKDHATADFGTLTVTNTVSNTGMTAATLTGTNGGFAFTDGTADVPGTGAKTADATGLNADAIKTAAAAVTTDGNVIVKKGADDKLELYVGTTKIGTSAAAVDGTATDFEIKADDGGASLGTIKLSAATAAADITGDIDTGLDFKAAVAGNGGGGGGAADKAKFTLKLNNVDIATDVEVDAGKSAADIADAVLTKLGGDGTEVTVNNVVYTVAKNGNTVEFTMKDDPTTADQTKGDFDWNISGTGVNGTHTGGTKVLQQGQLASDALKANTVFKVDLSDIKDGTKITIDGVTKTIKVGNTTTNGDVVLTEDEAKDLDVVLGRISEAFGGTAGNFIVGVNNKENGQVNQGLTVQKAGTAGTYDTMEKLAAVFKIEVPGDANGGLQLQIGDTSESFNQLHVSIGDMHAEALGIKGLDIGSADKASAAIQKIKDAINNVSSVRGDLGAYQNRLEHTANNLSVMAENITDAESSIRDTDIAEEMMSYTKNNILVQSAQAMLAQANQVPQGVLQLLG